MGDLGKGWNRFSKIVCSVFWRMEFRCSNEVAGEEFTEYGLSCRFTRLRSIDFRIEHYDEPMQSEIIIKLCQLQI